MFWISVALIVIFVVMAAFPQLFTRPTRPTADLNERRESAERRRVVRPRHPGLRRLRPHDLRRPGLDPRRHLRHRRSPPLFGALVGVIAGLLRRLGRRADLAGSREIFLAIPLLLGGILFMYTFPDTMTRPPVVVVQGRLRARPAGLAGDRPADALERAAGQAERLRAGGPRSGREPAADHPLAHPAQRASPR